METRMGKKEKTRDEFIKKMESYLSCKKEKLEMNL